MKPARRWAVASVQGHMVGDAVVRKDDAWAAAYSALIGRDWVDKIELWDDFLRQAKQRGYYLARVEVREVER